MAADENGKDIALVGVPVTGSAWIAPEGTPIPTAELGKAVPKAVLDAAFQNLGLRTEDGAPEWTEEAEGDAIKFFEDGYSIPTGAANVKCAMTLAQTMPIVDELRSGAVYDDHGHTVIDAGGNTKTYVLFTEVVFKTAGGVYFIERRAAEKIAVESVVDQKEERGKPRGYVVTLRANRAGFGHYHKWLILPGAEAEEEDPEEG